MSRASAVLRSAWEFVVGDDWRIAAGVTAAVAATALLSAAGVGAWWLLPSMVAFLLALSVMSGSPRDGNRTPDRRRRIAGPEDEVSGG